ncbi:hypothetical protein [Bradyrhizobium sp. STM 3562]|uniref:hypothetical protein n=1 Tax=Bradyrhizobium sp. STM 3562 TaxID=578924 RepID=UPI00388FB6A2
MIANTIVCFTTGGNIGTAPEGTRPQAPAATMIPPTVARLPIHSWITRHPFGRERMLDRHSAIADLGFDAIRTPRIETQSDLRKLNQAAHATFSCD